MHCREPGRRPCHAHLRPGVSRSARRATASAASPYRRDCLVMPRLMADTVIRDSPLRRALAVGDDLGASCWTDALQADRPGRGRAPTGRSSAQTRRLSAAPWSSVEAGQRDRSAGAAALPGRRPARSRRARSTHHVLPECAGAAALACLLWRTGPDKAVAHNAVRYAAAARRRPAGIQAGWSSRSGCSRGMSPAARTEVVLAARLTGGPGTGGPDPAGPRLAAPELGLLHPARPATPARAAVASHHLPGDHLEGAGRRDGQQRPHERAEDAADPVADARRRPGWTAAPAAGSP